MRELIRDFWPENYWKKKRFEELIGQSISETIEIGYNGNWSDHSPHHQNHQLDFYSLRIGNGVGKQGYGNRPPIDDRNPIRKFSIDCLDASKNQRVNSASTDSPLQRIKEKSRYGISVLTPHRRYGHRLRTPFLRTPFPRLLYSFGD